MKKWLPWILPLFLPRGFWPAQPPKPNHGFDTAAWGRLPVLFDGRVQPLDSVARNSLLSISGAPGRHQRAAALRT